MFFHAGFRGKAVHGWDWGEEGAGGGEGCGCVWRGCFLVKRFRLSWSFFFFSVMGSVFSVFFCWGSWAGVEAWSTNIPRGVIVDVFVGVVLFPTTVSQCHTVARRLRGGCFLIRHFFAFLFFRLERATKEQMVDSVRVAVDFFFPRWFLVFFASRLVSSRFFFFFFGYLFDFVEPLLVCMKKRGLGAPGVKDDSGGLSRWPSYSTVQYCTV